MSSALEARPKLREDLTITRRESEGKVRYVVKIPDAQKYLQFGELEVGLMRLMDGRRTPKEISDTAARQLGVRPAAGQVADFAHRLKRLAVVERTPAEKHLMLMERLRGMRKVRSRRRSQGSILRLRFSIGDPDRLFGIVAGRIRWVWSPAFVAASAGLFTVYTAILAARWGDIWNGTVSLYTLSGIDASAYVIMWGIFLLVGGIHELGHGLTTKYFGGEVHEIGAMLLYFSPALFCNTNDAWTFERRSHRLWVTFAGPWIQLVIGALAAIAWVVTEPGTAVHTLAFLTVLVGGISAVLTNFNPLIPLDGYYALSDWLEIANLRPRAFEYWGWLARRLLMGVDAAQPKVTPRERRVFLIYGGLALVYSLLVGVLSFFWLVFILGRFLGPWIWAIVALFALRLALRVGGRARAIATAAATAARARRSRLTGLAGGVFVVMILPFVLPWTFRARGDFRVISEPRIQLRAETGGVLDQLYARQGDTVRAGEAIATLWDPALLAELVSHRARGERLLLTRSRAEATGDLASVVTADAAIREVRRELGVLEGRRERLTMRAPIDGVLLGHRLPERLGERLAEGALLAELASLEGRQARVRVPLELAGDLTSGQQAGLRLWARPNLEFRARVASVAPAADGRWLELEIPFPPGGWRPEPGMTGIAKVAMWRGTVAEAVGRAVRQTLRIDLWL